MIIWLASYPRSGNTYYRMLLHHAAGFDSQTAYDDSLMVRIGAAGIVGHKARTRSLDALQVGDDLHFVKTHELPSDSNPAVYIVRDGRDVLVSYAHFLNDTAKSKRLLQRARRQLLQRLGFDDFRRTLARLIVETEQWGGWSNHVLRWTGSRKGAATAIVRYEDLLTTPLRRSAVALTNYRSLFTRSGPKAPTLPSCSGAGLASFARESLAPGVKKFPPIFMSCSGSTMGRPWRRWTIVESRRRS